MGWISLIYIYLTHESYDCMTIYLNKQNLPIALLLYSGKNYHFADDFLFIVVITNVGRYTQFAQGLFVGLS